MAPTPRTLTTLPAELLHKKFDLLDKRSLINLARANKTFLALTGPKLAEVRAEEQLQAQGLVARAENHLSLPASNAHFMAGENGGLIEMPATEFPRLAEFNAIVDEANGMAFSPHKSAVLAALARTLRAPRQQDEMPIVDHIRRILDSTADIADEDKAAVLRPLASHIATISSEEDRHDVFNRLLDGAAGMSVKSSVTSKFAANNLAVDAHNLQAMPVELLLEPIEMLDKSSLIQLALTNKKFYTLAQPRLQEIKISEEKASVLSTLAWSIERLPTEVQFDSVTHVLNHTAELTREQKIPVLVPLAKILGHLPDQQTTLSVFNAILTQMKDIDARHQAPVQRILANKIDSLPEGKARIDAFYQVHSATMKIPIEQKASVLTPLGKSILSLPEGQDSLSAFNATLKASEEIPYEEISDNLRQTLEDQSNDVMAAQPPYSFAMVRVSFRYRDIPEGKAAVLTSLANSISNLSENESKLTAFNSLIEQSTNVPPALKINLIEALLNNTRNLPQNESSDAFDRTLNASMNMPPMQNAIMLERYVDDKLLQQTSASQKTAEFQSIFQFAVSQLPGPARLVVLPALHNKFNACFEGEPERKLIAFNAMLAENTQRLEEYPLEMMTYFARHIPELPEAPRADAVERILLAATAMPTGEGRYRVLHSLAEHRQIVRSLPEELRLGMFDGILKCAANLPDDMQRSVQLDVLELTPAWPRNKRLEAFRSLLKATGNLSQDDDRASVLIELGETLGEAQQIALYSAMLDATETMRVDHRNAVRAAWQAR